MILHVAEAGEDRGRVVLRLGPLRPASDAALKAAVMVAQAFGSEMESLFIEDSQLFDLAGFPFVRETSLSGLTTRPILVPDLERDVKAIARALHRRVAEVAAPAKVRVRSARCATTRCGRWRWRARKPVPGTSSRLPSRRRPKCGRELRELFDGVVDSTGVVLAGPRSRAVSGPVVAAVDELDRLQPMMRAASRLAAVNGGEVRLVLIGPDDATLAWMEGQARLALGGAQKVRLDAVRLASDGTAAANMLRSVRRASSSPASAVRSSRTRMPSRRWPRRWSVRCFWCGEGRPHPT